MQYFLTTIRVVMFDHPVYLNRYHQCIDFDIEEFIETETKKIEKESGNTVWSICLINRVKVTEKEFKHNEEKVQKR